MGWDRFSLEVRPNFKSPFISDSKRLFDTTYLKEAKELTVKETELPSDIPHLDWQTIS